MSVTGDLVAVRSTDLPTPSGDWSIVSRFDAVAAGAGAELALVSNTAALTFSDVQSRANRWCGELLARGAAPGDRIALLMKHDAPTVVAALAALKAGGTVVVLNASEPTARLRSIIEDATPGWLLTDATNVEKAGLISGSSCNVLCLDDLQGPNFAPDSALITSLDQLAFLIYTSGTTGRPKAVMRTHRNVLHQMLRYQDAMDIHTGDRVTLFASLSTGQGLSSTWCALLNGATACPYAIREMGISGIADWMEEQGITTYISTTTVFRHFISTLDRPRQFTKVRLVRLGAEPAIAQDFRSFQRHFPDHCVLLHTYSSSETGNVTQLRLEKGSRVAEGPLPVGRPAVDVEVCIVDENGSELPPGEIGEIAIRSQYLSPGYWGNAGLTAARFLGTAKNEPRTFLSGDRGFLTADGELIHLGRNDDRIKVNGFRVEPGEVERALTSHPDVQQAVVTIRKNHSGEDRLVAYYIVCASLTTAVSPNGLLTFLQKRLPGYMLPSAIVPVDAFPLTPSGKIDRRALPLPVAPASPAPGTLGPRNMMEALLSAVWRDLLDGRPFGVRDDFFALGGDSLLAVTMVARVEQLCGRKLSLAKVFAGATIEHLSQVLLKEPEVRQEESPLMQVQAGGSRRPFFFLHGDFLGGGFYCLKLARQLGADQPFYALAPHGVAGTAMPTSVQAMAGDYLERVRSVQPEGPYLLGGYCNAALVAFEMAQQLCAQRQKVDLLVLLAPGSLNRGQQTPARPIRLLDRLHLETLPLHYRRVVAIKLCSDSCRQYFPGPYAGPLTILQPNEELRGGKDRSRGWKDFAPGVEIRVIPGGHETCLTAHAHTVGDQLRNCLHRAGAAAGSGRV
jgi:amino acid adenylation domain-containing protein